MNVSAVIALIKAVFSARPLHDPGEVIGMSTRILRRKAVPGLINEYCGAA